MQDSMTNLNKAQHEAVLHESGPIVVFAGAGSGKTRVITTRIAHLISKGVLPQQILAVTFTNKAAREMRERVLRICPDGHGATITTFHSACARWLREFGHELGFTSDFTIFDDTDSKNALKNVVKTINSEVELDSLIPDYKYFIHVAKTNALAPQATQDLKNLFGERLPTGAIEVYKRYQEFLHQCNAMDFGDLLLNMLLLLRTNRVVKDILQQRFQHVLIDEYQDTNATQMELVRHIVEKHQNIMVVGDDDQSIYSWRGAIPQNILDFDKHYESCRRVLLEENYRSSSTIVDAAAQVIKNNQHRASKTLRTANEGGELIDFIVESDGELEAWAIANSIKSERDKFPFEEVAIFYRTNSQSRQIEDALRHENIPYRIFGSVKFYDRLEVKDVLAYLRLLANPSDDISFIRAVNTPPRGIGAKAIEQLQKMAREQKNSLLSQARILVQDNVPKLAKKYAPFTMLMDHLEAQLGASDLDEVVDVILDATHYSEYLKKKFPDQYLEKVENVYELNAAISDFLAKTPGATLLEWLQSITLESDKNAVEADEGVSLMTLHMAKGLEFDRVFIAGCEENLLPHANSIDDPMTCEEERRLFYVGMTRARKKLSLYTAYYRRMFNKPQKNQPSRFIGEIPRNYFSNTEALAPREENPSYHQDDTIYDYGDSQIDGGSSLQLNQSVFHLTYGKGTIVDLQAWPEAHKVVVDFEEFGRRKVSTSQLNPS